MKAKHPPKSNPHRGYSFVGQECLSALNRADKGLPMLAEIKEAWDQGAPDDPEDDNIWPENSDIPGFRDFMEDFFEKSHEALLTLLRACAIGFGLDEHHFEDKLTTRRHELRLLHYPEVNASTVDDKSLTRASDHTDFGLLTLLWQDSVGGLEIEDQRNDGVFHPVITKENENEMIVNVGDSLMRWTNGHLCSGMHRVVLRRPEPHEPATIPGRRSIVFFGKPDREGSVGPIPELLQPGETPRYKEMTAGEYNQSRLVRVYGDHQTPLAIAV